MKPFMLLIFGIAIGAAAVWFYTTGSQPPAIQKAEDRAAATMDRARDSVRDAAEQAKQAFGTRLEALNLRAEDIKKELGEAGGVIRRTARDMAEKTADVAEDTRITAAVKAKLAADPELSVFSISVNTTGGVVTLAGTVESHELIGKAVTLVLEMEGVREVVSTLQVK